MPENSDCTLTEKQRRHYETFGYLVVRGAFDAAEMATLSAAFDRARRFGTGAADDQVWDFLERIEGMAHLLEDERTAGLARHLLGPAATYMENVAKVHSGAEWWQATMGWDVRIPAGRTAAEGNMDLGAHYYSGARLTIELDAVGPGCRRVIAGSHREPYHDQLWSLSAEVAVRGGAPASQQAALEALCDRDEIYGERRTRLFDDPAANAFELAAEEVPHMAIESQPGDLVVLDHMLWHACIGGRPHRIIAVDWKGAPTADEQCLWWEERLPQLRNRQQESRQRRIR